jgi:hypothetical protein
MRSRTFAALGAGVAALVLATTLTPVANAQPGAARGARICYKNMSADHDTGAAIPSNNYNDPNSIFDSQAADDFTLTEPCFARLVSVAGTFLQQSVVDWETVYIYPDAGGKPGFPAIWVQSALNGKQGKKPGDFNIKFGPIMLQPGTYWISVQAQLKNGKWGWDTTDLPSGSSAVFQNPDQGIPGCPTWTAIQTCFPGTPGADLMFTLKR